MRLRGAEAGVVAAGSEGKGPVVSEVAVGGRTRRRVLIVAVLALTRMHGTWRTVAVVPTVYLAAIVWENSFVEQPAVARWILFGSLLVFLMTVRPQGLLGTPRVEIV